MAVSTHSKSPKSLFYFNFTPTSGRLQQTKLPKFPVQNYRFPPFHVAIHSRFSETLCRELREWSLPSLPVHSRHQDGGRQGYRLVLCHLLGQCAGVLRVDAQASRGGTSFYF